METRPRLLFFLLLASGVGLFDIAGLGHGLQAAEFAIERADKPSQIECAVALHIHHADADPTDGPTVNNAVLTSLDLVKSVVNGPQNLPLAAALLGQAPDKGARVLGYGLQLVFHARCDQRIEMSQSIANTLVDGHSGSVSVEAIPGRLPLGDRAFPTCDPAYWDCPTE